MSAAIAALLSEHLGLLPQTLGDRAVELAVRARLEATGTDAADRYAARLRDDRVELDALVEEIIVPETWFFRDGEPFRSLSRWARARQRPGGRPLCVLSAPCSTGEEPYSIAMTLLDAGLAAGTFIVHALDISGRNLQRARAAIYGELSFRGGGLDARDRYCTPLEGRRWQVVDAVRALVTFERRNLMEPALLAGASFDAIFCRNVFIYLHQAARRRVLESIDRLLVPDGRLFIGHADPVETPESTFRTVGESGAFAFERRAARTPAAARPARAATPLPARPVPARAVAAAAAPPDEPGPPAITLLSASSLADRGELTEAVAQIERLLARGGPSADAYHLLGVIRVAEQRPQEAEVCFGKALYLDRTHHHSLLHLALLCDRRGDRASADNYRRRADSTRPKDSAP